jgi:Fe-S cluster biogenesis protein NfuA
LTSIHREVTTTGLDTLAIMAEPLDGRRCRFVVGRPVYPGRWAYFAGAEQARDAPLADRLFAIEGVIGRPVHVPNEAELRARIQRVLDEQVNPVIAGHGGGVSILDIKDNVVYVPMWGGCQGCGLADMTLKNGVKAAVRDAVPEVGEIIDLTNHRAG